MTGRINLVTRAHPCLRLTTGLMRLVFSKNPKRILPTLGYIIFFTQGLLAGYSQPLSIHPSTSTVERVGATDQFQLETIVDFADDATSSGRPLTIADIDALMQKIAALGIKRVSWAYYGDGHGGYLNPTGYREAYQGEWDNYNATYRGLVNPLRVAVEAGHRHGLEVYAYFKPYETGPAYAFPEGSPEAKQWGLLPHKGGRLVWMDPFVRDHPSLRIKRRADDLPPNLESIPICALRLIKTDDSPTRIKQADIQIWTSPDNFCYRPKEIIFKFEDLLEIAPKDIRDLKGNLTTRKGDQVRVLTLSGLNLADKYVLITTSLTQGTPDFTNTGLAILQVLDAKGREIPGVFATGNAIAFASLSDFRHAGLMYDHGFGAKLVTLDAPNSNGRQGLIAYTRGRNEYLGGALCETEPAVQQFWLDCLEEIISSGVDGVDFREENHSTHTDYPHEYGFNEIVLQQARQRTGDLVANIAEVRGEAYTDFLRRCKARLAKAGKLMRYNLQIDYFRPTPPPERLLAYPLNLHFDWRRWIDEGLMDAVILRFFSYPPSAIFEDTIAKEMITRCQVKGLPMTINRYITKSHTGDTLTNELQQFRRDGRFAGFIFYEVYSYIKYGPNPGECEISLPAVSAAAASLH